MANYTQEIKQLTKTASATPQFAAPSSTLGGDLVNLASTGMQFYQQHEAKKQLGVAKEAQAAQNKLLATGQEDLRQVRLLAQQGVSSTDIRKREEKLRQRYSPEEWWAILSETNKVSKVTSSEAMSSADRALEKQVSDRKTLESEAAKISPYLPFALDLNADSETLNQAILIGQSKFAEIQAKKARAELRSSELTVKGKEGDFARDAFVIEFQGAAEAAYVKTANDLLSKADFNDPSQVAQLIQHNDELKRSFISTAVSSAKQAGVVLTPAQAETQFSGQMKIFDMVSRQLSRKDVKEIGENEMAARVTSSLFAMQQAGTPSQQNLATLFMYSPYLPKDALGTSIMNAYAGALTENIGIGGAGDMASVFRLAPVNIETPSATQTPLEVKTQAQEKKGRFQRIKDLFKNADENVPQETKDAYTNLVLEDLQGSEATQKEMLEGGGFVTYVQAMSKGTPTNLMSAEKQDKVVEGMMNYADKFLRRAIPQLLTEQVPSDSSTFTRALPPKGFEVGLPTTDAVNRLNALNPDTLKVTWNQKAAISNNVKSYNKFIDDLFTSLDKLGVTDEETAYLKSEISRAFVVANNADAVK